MKYIEVYRQIDSMEELKERVKEDVGIAIFLGGNPDRIRAIEDAMNERAKELEECV